jgi:FkbM family methyltransferase
VGAGLRFDAGGANPGYALGTTEPLVQEALAGLLRPADVFYDIGANVGFFTILGAHMVGPGGRVFAFEPLPENAVALRRNAALNGFDHVTLIEAAVSHAAGTATLFTAAEPTWAKLATPGDAQATERTVTVRLVTIDDLLAEGSVAAPTLVKIDVEGAELDVIAGMTHTIERHRPVILCEMHGKNHEFAALMRALAYDVTVIEGPGPLEEARWDVHALARPR